MRILREGDHGQALAPAGGLVTVVYEYRTLRMEETGVDVPDVLVGVCTETDEVLTVPAQSAPKLKAAREAAKEATYQVRLPEQLKDVLFLLAEHYQTEGKKFWPAAFRFYLDEFTRSERFARRVVRLAASPLAGGGPRRRFAVRTSVKLLADVDRRAAEHGINRSDLARGVIIAAKQDVLDGRAGGRAAKLEAVARAV